MKHINNAIKAGACCTRACDIAGLSIRTLQRWKKSDNLTDLRQVVEKPSPSHKLTDKECQMIIDVCNSPQFASCAIGQIVPALADSGIYIASESSFYRVLRTANQMRPRARVNRSGQYAKPKAHTATQANQLWSWDITFLASRIKGVFYYLYLIMDVYSRKIVGWEIHKSQNDRHASDLLKKAKLSENLNSTDKLTLHSDNGSPMKGATMLSTMQTLGVAPSFSRPSVSNDNPFSESLFKTLKYVPSMPEKPFASIEHARAWAGQFTQWYNYEHKHSQIKYVTPNQRHTGKDIQILEKRKEIFLSAKNRNPQRWSRNIRNWDHVGQVWLNKYDSENKEKIAA